MDRTSKFTLIGGLLLVAFMLIQNNYSQKSDAIFNEYQAKIYESRVEQFQANGMSPYQSNLIAGAIRDESFMVKNMITSNALIQSYSTMMSSLCLLMILLYAIKKSK